jgi:hypothetical protein
MDKDDAEIEGAENDDEDESNMLRHSDSYERSGRVDPDEELLGAGVGNLISIDLIIISRRHKKLKTMMRNQQLKDFRNRKIC